MNNEMDVKLTSEQIESWRRVLCSMIGSVALEATEEQIQVFAVMAIYEARRIIKGFAFLAIQYNIKRFSY